MIGVLLAALVAGVGIAMLWSPEQRGLGKLLIALAPMTIVANLGTLPTAILVRDRCFARIFAVDMIMITTLTSVSIGTAALGAGEWSLVYAWHANALASLIAATIFAAPLIPKYTGGATSLESVRKNGAHFTGAALLGYFGERLDSASVGFVLGRPALALFELAQVRYSFGDNFQSNRVRQRNDRPHHVQWAFLGVDRAGEGPIDLDGVERQPVQVAQRRIPGPEVVEMDGDA